MLAVETRTQSADPPPDVVRRAFRELHGRRLHGFALLLTLGDAPRAAQLTAAALTAGSARLEDLRHPERAAAWLRARIVASSRRLPRGDRPMRVRIQALTELGADQAVVLALMTLSHIERAALIAANLERLDRRDVGTIVGKSGSALERLLIRARQRYAAGYAPGASDLRPAGPVAARLHAIAERAMG